MRASKVASSCRPVHGTRPPLEPGGVGGAGLPHRHGRRAVGRSAAGAIAFSGPEGRSEERTPKNRPRPVASVTSSGWGRSVDRARVRSGGSDPGPFMAGVQRAHSRPCFTGARDAYGPAAVPAAGHRGQSGRIRPGRTAVPVAAPAAPARGRPDAAAGQHAGPAGAAQRGAARPRGLARRLGRVRGALAAAQAARADPALAEPGHAQRLGGAQPGLARPRVPAGRHRLRGGAGAARPAPADPGPDPAPRDRRRRHPARLRPRAAARCSPR